MRLLGHPRCITAILSNGRASATRRPWRQPPRGWLERHPPAPASSPPPTHLLQRWQLERCTHDSGHRGGGGGHVVVVVNVAKDGHHHLQTGVRRHWLGTMQGTACQQYRCSKSFLLAAQLRASAFNSKLRSEPGAAAAQRHQSSRPPSEPGAATAQRQQAAHLTVKAVGDAAVAGDGVTKVLDLEAAAGGRKASSAG